MKFFRLALGAAFALMLTGPVAAADLGGNCCADLEERVSELEATTARKGNRKVSVVIYGQVSKAILWNNIGAESTKTIIDNGNAPTMVGIRGEGKVSPTLSAGFVVELGVGNFAEIIPGINPQPLISDTYVRQANVWIEGAVGRLTLGKGLMATDAVGGVTLANTAVAARMLSLEPLGSAICPIGGCDLWYDGGRRNVVRYDSPTLSGFIISASWSSASPVIGTTPTPTDAWDVAIKYAGEFSGIRVAAAVGYRDENYVLGATDSLVGHDHGYVGSASIMHMGSGLFLSGAYGKSFDALFAASGIDDNMWHVQGGIEKNATGLGALTFYGEYGAFDATGLGAKPTLYGVGVVQRIDGAAADIFASYRRYELDGAVTLPNGRDNADVFMTGVRVRF